VCLPTGLPGGRDKILLFNRECGKTFVRKGAESMFMRLFMAPDIQDGCA
jgi:hypothetical protein